MEDQALWASQLKQQQINAGQIARSNNDTPDQDDTAGLPLDWKGDPMHINPGDKLPFKFL